MTVAIDPGAVLERAGSEALVHVVACRLKDGRIHIVWECNDETVEALTLRADFLSEFVAQARASEQSAA